MPESEFKKPQDGKDFENLRKEEKERLKKEANLKHNNWRNAILLSPLFNCGKSFKQMAGKRAC